LNFDFLSDTVNLQRDVFDEGVPRSQYYYLIPGLKTLVVDFQPVGSCGQLRELIATLVVGDG